MANLRTIFGHRLKAFRTAKGLTQEELGNAIGIDYKHLGAIERGVKSPSFEVVEKLAKALEIAPYKLFLPPDVRNSDVEMNLRLAIEEMDGVQRSRIQKFLTEILRTIKKLDVS